MSLFFESIRIADGKPENLDLHQQRVNRSLQFADGNELLLEPIVRRYSFPEKGLYKFRISYDTLGVVDLSCSPYQKKDIRSIQLLDVGEYSYAYKFEDRKFIERCAEMVDADEIIMVKNGMLTDASYANLAFFDGSCWWTPRTCLLPGTRRQQLLEEGKIEARDIHHLELGIYSLLRLINAMMPWDQGIELPLSAVKGLSR